MYLLECVKPLIILTGPEKLPIQKNTTLLFCFATYFLGDGIETIADFSSQKQRKILKEERYAADEWLDSQNPNLCNLLYTKYEVLY